MNMFQVLIFPLVVTISSPLSTNKFTISIDSFKSPGFDSKSKIIPFKLSCDFKSTKALNFVVAYLANDLSFI